MKEKTSDLTNPQLFKQLLVNYFIYRPVLTNNNMEEFPKTISFNYSNCLSKGLMLKKLCNVHNCYSMEHHIKMIALMKKMMEFV